MTLFHAHLHLFRIYYSWKDSLFHNILPCPIVSGGGDGGRKYLDECNGRNEHEVIEANAVMRRKGDASCEGEWHCFKWHKFIQKRSSSFLFSSRNFEIKHTFFIKNFQGSVH